MTTEEMLDKIEDLETELSVVEEQLSETRTLLKSKIEYIDQLEASFKQIKSLANNWI